MTLLRNLFVIASMFTLFSCASSSEVSQVPQGAAVESCDDFFAAINKKTAHMKFEGCKAAEQFGQRVLKASYSVEGKHAKEVEKFLVSEFKLKPLKFACCGWETPPTSFREANGQSYTLWMSSIETTEKDWNKISNFRVTLDKDLDEP